MLAQQEDAAEAGKEAVRAACKEQARLAESQNAQTEAERRLALQRENAALLKSAVPFLKRILRYRKDPMVKKWLETEQAVQETLIQVTRLKSARHEQEDAARSAQETLQQAEAKLADANAAVEPERARFGGNWADAAFWKNISANEPSQTACPWTCAGFDRAREELFYQALMLHKAFTLSSNCVKQNLRRLFAMWDGKFTDKADCRAAYADLLNTLLLIVPVISTTFASVQSFLDGVQAEELGLLVVDESGQATPQSALGALWRTRSAIVVGDPLQVEPIVTIPAELRKRFADENGIPEPYRLPDLSVQVLADPVQPLWRRPDAERGSAVAGLSARGSPPLPQPDVRNLQRGRLQRQDVPENRRTRRKTIPVSPIHLAGCKGDGAGQQKPFSAGADRRGGPTGEQGGCGI